MLALLLKHLFNFFIHILKLYQSSINHNQPIFKKVFHLQNGSKLVIIGLYKFQESKLS